MSDPELESFKTNIDLRAYAAGRAYYLDRKESWAGSAVMRHASGDKIVVKRDTDGHFVYFSVRDDADNGTIIDFAKRRLGCSLGGVRKELRPWISASPMPLPSFAPLQPVPKDRIRVERAYSRMRNALTHAYLENERGIPRDLLASPRFAAVDNDAAGSEIADIIAKAVQLTGRYDLQFELHVPVGKKDWNDVLRARPPCPLPCQTDELSVR